VRWRGRRTSRNLEDRRRDGAKVGGGAMIGGLGAVIFVVIGLCLGVDPSALLGGGGLGLQGTPDHGAPAGPNQIDDAVEEFVGVVLANTEEVWAVVFEDMGRRYEPPVLVLFSGRTASACGTADAAAGPFYCPGDRKAYLNTAFFRVMADRLGAKGDFAQAYVIAHEIAHHVQNLLGILARANASRARASEIAANRISVMIELQADCFSGVWARRAQARFGALEPGDIEEALNAASQIGDDTLQRNAGRAVVPDSFQHGTSAQRVRWFRIGFDSGDPGRCDTFSARWH